MGRPYRKFRKMSGAHIGARARAVYVCDSCEVQQPPGQPKPKVCPYCGGLAFTRFDSTGECGRWNTLRLLQSQGKISNLERQVRFPLMAARTIEGRTVAAKAVTYIADFVYERDGERVIEDFKSAGIMSDVADLKLKWMEAMGLPVKIVT